MFSRRILIDIDTLLDTRLGVIRTERPDAFNLIDPDIYQKRLTDDMFKIVGIKDFKTMYDRRDKRALVNSFGTHFLLTELPMLLKREQISIDLGTPNERPTITINSWPYKLSLSEMEEFKRLIAEQVSFGDIEIINLPYPELSLSVLSTSWDCWFLYDYYGWATLHAMQWGEFKNPSFVFYRPAILYHEATHEQLDQIEKDKVHPFNRAKQTLAEVFTLDFVDAKLFSAAYGYTYESVTNPFKP